MKYGLCFFLLITISTANAQNIWLKGYGGLERAPQQTLVGNPGSMGFYPRATNSVFAMPAIALELKKGAFWEFGFSGSWHKEDPVYSSILDSTGYADLGAAKYKRFQAQIELNFPILAGLESRWQPFIGLALNPHWSKNTFTPHQSNLFPVTGKVIGAHWGVVPRFQFKWKKNLYLDINACLFLLSTDYNQNIDEDPSIPPALRDSEVLDFGLLSKYALRLGLAWKIGGRGAE